MKKMRNAGNVIDGAYTLALISIERFSVIERPLVIPFIQHRPYIIQVLRSSFFVQ
ncbi:uncharacterized protein C8R40DRAFT_1100959 [Lentinula edodes]|uniref:uncharacterized protein n=1 Tax=Lentinula edodes TaxID=5353 RepID=UPI001E8E6630|nr:uncharacterized protein C8R40DRAFT_1100959 [Lentinula edodes]KAH7876138.1 hypothetical protein C8R40DRAFT_1100959 [Lentinula edodes]